MNNIYMLPFILKIPHFTLQIFLIFTLYQTLYARSPPDTGQILCNELIELLSK